MESSKSGGGRARRRSGGGSWGSAAGDDESTTPSTSPPRAPPSSGSKSGGSAGAGALGGLPWLRRRAEHLLLQCLGHDIFIFSIVVFFLTDIYKRLAAPATDQLPRSTGAYAGDGIVACTPEFEKIIVAASKYRIRCGSQSGSSWSWPNTFRLDWTALGQPIGPVTEQRISWVANVVRPMKQPKQDTCALVACTVAVEAMHRLVYGEGRAFRWKAAVPEHLLGACKRNNIWRPGTGAPVEEVLDKIRQLSGVPVVTNNPATKSNPAMRPRLPLPLGSWEVHRLGDDDLRSVAELLRRGPCVATLWTCPWYQRFNASLDGGAWVYRGCGRSQAFRDECERLYGEQVGFHAVVCFGYRLCGDQMHVLVLDNHDDTGPWRWVDVKELHALYTFDFGCLDDLDHCPLLRDPWCVPACSAGRGWCS
ncbi:hypothetical protein ACP70R_050199 [Stipagrostis hirtigluma subsp. patula]